MKKESGFRNLSEYEIFLLREIEAGREPDIGEYAKLKRARFRLGDGPFFRHLTDNLSFIALEDIYASLFTV